MHRCETLIPALLKSAYKEHFMWMRMPVVSSYLATVENHV